ncbi:hypothetical protein OIU34_36995 [Pararhizobium sp. BT-229]|uniref:hypothetical protein n=1 Tax=Pararhizobium sp. BT-229 TaxID=2986923 RepID=UPI0021F71337|nr:hypothetical protein [Pararhizobium sp. BT-229]MCV9967433.1 hypothetical protein [Pararhizobium sp. BT-229]
MIYSEEKSGGLAVPIFVILLAIAGILAALVAIGGQEDRQSGRVWVFQKPTAVAAIHEGPGIDRYDK